MGLDHDPDDDLRAYDTSLVPVRVHRARRPPCHVAWTAFGILVGYLIASLALAHNLNVLHTELMALAIYFLYLPVRIKYNGPSYSRYKMTIIIGTAIHLLVAACASQLT